MNEFRLNNVEMLHLLWAAPVLAAVFLYAAKKRKDDLALFAKTSLLERKGIFGRKSRRGIKAALVCCAIMITAFALARPQWNPKPREVTRNGRDVVFLLDVSRSMLADDLAPNRLERAKLAIKDCVEKLSGDRVALVAFSGASAVKCPLTLDYGFFRMSLDELYPGCVARGGTMIGDSLRKALKEVFDDKDAKFRDVILITDGEDQESFPVEAARAAGEKGVRLLAIGLGDPEQGRRIPVTDENGNKTFLKYKGEEVWTKLDADTLRKMAAATPGGRYLNVATGAFDLGQIYMDLIASAEKKKLEAQTARIYEEKFQIFLALALVLLIIETMLAECKPNNEETTAQMEGEQK